MHALSVSQYLWEGPTCAEVGKHAALLDELVFVISLAAEFCYRSLPERKSLIFKETELLFTTNPRHAAITSAVLD